MAIIEEEPIHGPPPQGLIFMLVVMCAAVLGLLLVTACGSGHPTRISAAANATPSPACLAWQRSGGTGQLAELNQGMKAISADLKSGNQSSLQVDGLAMSQITGMGVVTNAPPVASGAWVRMVLDLNKMGEQLTGGDLIGASSNLGLAQGYASVVGSALHRACGF